MEEQSNIPIQIALETGASLPPEVLQSIQQEVFRMSSSSGIGVKELHILVQSEDSTNNVTENDPPTPASSTQSPGQKAGGTFTILLQNAPETPKEDHIDLTNDETEMKVKNEPIPNVQSALTEETAENNENGQALEVDSDLPTVQAESNSVTNESCLDFEIEESTPKKRGRKPKAQEKVLDVASTTQGLVDKTKPGAPKEKVTTPRRSGRASKPSVKLVEGSKMQNAGTKNPATSNDAAHSKRRHNFNQDEIPSPRKRGRPPKLNEEPSTKVAEDAEIVERHVESSEMHSSPDHAERNNPTVDANSVEEDHHDQNQENAKEDIDYFPEAQAGDSSSDQDANDAPSLPIADSKSNLPSIVPRKHGRPQKNAPKSRKEEDKTYEPENEEKLPGARSKHTNKVGKSRKRTKKAKQNHKSDGDESQTTQDVSENDRTTLGRIKKETNLDSGKATKKTPSIAQCHLCNKLVNMSIHNCQRLAVHKCEECKKRYKTTDSLSRHVSIVHRKGENPTPPCSVCGKVLQSVHSLKAHMKIHDKIKPFICEICSKGFAQKVNLESHVNGTHKRLKTFLCNICGEEFSHKAAVDYHQAAHQYQKSMQECASMFEVGIEKSLPNSKPELKCPLCDELYTHIVKYLFHLKEHVDGGSTFTDEDEDGNKLKKTKDILAKYGELLSTKEIHKCQECGKVFLTRSELNRHLKRHESVFGLPFQCKYCDKRFSSVSGRGYHQRSHKEEYSNAQFCQICSQGFASMKTYERHMRLLHETVKKDTTKVLFQCPECGKTFATSYNLRVHHRTHNQERPFVCPVCSKDFSDPANLKAHGKRHHSDSPKELFSCSVREKNRRKYKEMQEALNASIEVSTEEGSTTEHVKVEIG